APSGGSAKATMRARGLWGSPRLRGEPSNRAVSAGRGPFQRRGWRAGERGAHVLRGGGGEPVSGALVVRLYNDANHLFGSRGPQQDSPGITELVLSLLNRSANRGRGDGGGRV